jgi:hypothetical protein
VRTRERTVTAGASARRRLTTWLAVGVAAIAIAMLVFLLAALLVLPGSEELPYYDPSPVTTLASLAAAAAHLSMVLTGALLAILRPSNVIGWLLLLAGFSFYAWIFSGEYATRAVYLGSSLPGYQLVDWLYPVHSLTSSLLIGFWIPLLFPDGHLPGPSWRPVAYAMATMMALGIGSALLTDDSTEDFGRALPNPTAIGGTAEEVLEAVDSIATIPLLVLLAMGIASVVVRFRRSVGVERLQLKWFLAAVGLVVASMIGMAALFFLGLQDLSNASYFVFNVIIGLVPIAIGIAVLRYRLYEIDRLISRTIGWALVTGLLVGAFALLVLGSSAVLEPLTGGNTLAVAGSTLVVALLFAPLRRRVQRAVDRRFDRSRYDGERTLAAFGERLRYEVDLPTIRADVLATVETSVRPSRVGLWLRNPGGEG